ncbi:MAG: T9SS type A sorting domain-containing protein [Bacteroidetes bacterium]|nr:T9SS type A sorting domain-containing protein [Bacteroidota bacterium]
MKKVVLFLIIVLLASTNVKSQSLTFTAAFDSMHNKLSVYYAFTEWKGINWNNLYNEFQPKIAAAQTTNDSIAFYSAVRQYLFTIPDGHVMLLGWWDKMEEFKYRKIGGSYGFALIELDNGDIVTRLIADDSPAALAGMQFGAKILEINGQEINSVLDTVSTLFAESIPATSEGKKLNQFRFIGRATVGDTIKVKFLNRGSTTPQTVLLSAVDDNYETLNKTSLNCSRDTLPYVSYEKLQPSGFGYLRLTSLGGSDSSIAEIYSGFAEAISYFINENVPGIVLDLRINEGGEDFLAAALSGFFYSDTTLYEYISFYNPTSGQFEIYPDFLPHINSQTGEPYINTNYPQGSWFIEPTELHFNKPIVVMNSTRQISSGEGVAMALQKLPNCNVVSLCGSQGSFGIIDFDQAIWLSDFPNPLAVGFPHGRSLDENQNIQVDSDENMIGGVMPDFRPPLNDEVIDKMFLQNIDYELEYAVDHLATLVNIEDKHEAIAVSDFNLYQNYPNPFNPTTNIKYQLAENGLVTLKLFDVLGQEVKILINEFQESGTYEIKLDAAGLAGGVYFVQLRCGTFQHVIKMILNK